MTQRVTETRRNVDKRGGHIRVPPPGGRESISPDLTFRGSMEQAHSHVTNQEAEATEMIWGGPPHPTVIFFFKKEPLTGREPISQSARSGDTHADVRQSVAGGHVCSPKTFLQPCVAVINLRQYLSARGRLELGRLFAERCQLRPYFSALVFVSCFRSTPDCWQTCGTDRRTPWRSRASLVHQHKIHRYRSISIYLDRSISI